MWLLCLPGVYHPQDDTLLLKDALKRERLPENADVLDLGTGTGALALSAAERGAAQVTAVDASVSAVLTTRLNARLNRRRVKVLRGDLTAPVTDRRFDLIMANPPYVPSPEARPARGRALAWDAGADGRVVLDRICSDAPPLLTPGGVLLLVHSGLCGVERTLGRLRRTGLRAVVVERRYIPFGPVLRGRSAWLEARGLIAAGEEKEELVVVRAERER